MIRFLLCLFGFHDFVLLSRGMLTHKWGCSHCDHEFWEGPW